MIIRLTLKNAFVNHTHFMQKHIGKIKHSSSSVPFRFTNRTQGFAIKYVQQGTEFYHLNQRALPVREGQFILLPKDQDYQVVGRNTSITKGLCIDLYDLQLNKTLANDKHNQLLTGTPLDCVFTEQLGKSLASIAMNEPNYTESADASCHIINGLETDLLLMLEQVKILNFKLGEQVKKLNTRRQLITKLIAAKEYIHRNFQQPLSLDHISQHAGISKFYFIRLFKLVYECSPMQMQETLKMEKAQLLLMDESYSLTSIANELGFTDSSAFIHKFKREYAVTPGEYRRTKLR